MAVWSKIFLRIYSNIQLRGNKGSIRRQRKGLPLHEKQYLILMVKATERKEERFRAAVKRLRVPFLEWVVESTLRTEARRI